MIDLAPTWQEDVDHAEAMRQWVEANPYYRTFDWTPDRELLSQLGERVFSTLTGWPMRRVIGPDGGWDFDIDGVLVDVKACWSPSGKALCVERGFDFRAHYYVLVIVHREARRGRVVGYIDVDTLRNAGTLEWACTRAPGHCLAAAELDAGVPDWMLATRLVSA